MLAATEVALAADASRKAVGAKAPRTCAVRCHVFPPPAFALAAALAVEGPPESCVEEGSGVLAWQYHLRDWGVAEAAVGAATGVVYDGPGNGSTTADVHPGQWSVAQGEWADTRPVPGMVSRALWRELVDGSDDVRKAAAEAPAGGAEPVGVVVASSKGHDTGSIDGTMPRCSPSGVCLGSRTGGGGPPESCVDEGSVALAWQHLVRI